MSEAVISSIYRARIAECMAGGRALLPAGFIAFGDGGHTPDMMPRGPDQSAQTLYHELLRKPLVTLTQDDAYSFTATATVLAGEMTGVYLSEAALLDTSGQIIGMKTFAPKFKEADETYPVSIKIRY